MKTPTIETERIILRPLKIEDAQQIFERWTSDKRVTKFMSYNTHKNVEETKQWLFEEISNYESDCSYVWGFEIKQNHCLFGSGGLYYRKEKDMYELGYNIMYDFWNQGYTTEASRAVAEFAKNTLKVKMLYAHHAVENPASGRVMQKVGFVNNGFDSITSFDGYRTYKAKKYLLNL
jgi:ribosomal-protein-alanine N-acetyltransferase